MFIILHCRVLPPPPYLPLSSLSSLVYLIGIPFGRHLFCTAFIGLPSCDAYLPSLSQFIPVQLTAEPICSRYRTENKAYQHIIPKAALLSLFSTTVGPEHDPLLPNRVVNPWQPKFGTQGRAYRQWSDRNTPAHSSSHNGLTGQGQSTSACSSSAAGPQTFQSNAVLLGDIASHPQLRQHHQLAHVSWLAGS